MPHAVPRIILLVGALHGVGGGSARAQRADTAVSLRSGAYTEPQARRGERGFSVHCAPCHALEVFTDPFLLSWRGASVRLLYEVIRTSMPEDRPGSLKDGEYADILAYIFERNGFPPGAQELPSVLEQLDRILIERSP